jgi:hypothetical protein
MSTATSSTPYSETFVRRMVWDDVPRMLAIAEQTTSTWMPPNFRMQLQTNETMAQVAVREKQAVGFALCTVHHYGPGGRDGELESIWLRWSHWLRRLMGLADPLPRCIRLMAVGLAPQLADADEVERLLLERLDADLRGPADRLEMIVPETDLVAQSVLRDLGFVAERMLAGHYLHIDGWLMVRDEKRRMAARDESSRLARCAQGDPPSPGMF